MTTMVYCRGCGKQIHETAPMCPGCGAPQRLATASAAARPTSEQPTPEVPANWQRIFDLVERAGGPKLPRAQALPFSERRKLMFNLWGFLLGPIYYLAKGMWKKAITLFALSAVLFLVLDAIVTALHWPDGFLSFIAPAIFATRANVDYYKKVVLGDAGWW